MWLCHNLPRSKQIVSAAMWREVLLAIWSQNVIRHLDSQTNCKTKCLQRCNKQVSNVRSYCYADYSTNDRAQCTVSVYSPHPWYEVTQIARFTGPTWGPSGSDRIQAGHMLAPWTLLSGKIWHILYAYPLAYIIFVGNACVLVKHELLPRTNELRYFFCVLRSITDQRIWFKQHIMHNWVTTKTKAHNDGF